MEVEQMIEGKDFQLKVSKHENMAQETPHIASESSVSTQPPYEKNIPICSPQIPAISEEKEEIFKEDKKEIPKKSKEDVKKLIMDRVAEIQKIKNAPLIEHLKLDGGDKEQIFDLQPMKASFLSSSASYKFGESFGKRLHGKDWETDTMAMNEEISWLIAQDKERAASESKNCTEETKKRENGSLRVIPRVCYWSKKDPIIGELKAICKKSRQGENELRKTELENARQERILAEIRAQATIAELKTNLLNLKIAAFTH